VRQEVMPEPPDPKKIGLLPRPDPRQSLGTLFPVENMPFAFYSESEDGSGYWSCFHTLFDHEFLLWGAIGLLFPTEDAALGHVQTYKWAFWHHRENIEAPLRTFIDRINKAKNPEEYFLLGHIAEARTTPYDVLLLTDAPNVAADFSLVHAPWSSPLTQFLAAPSNGQVMGFHNYKNAVTETFPAHCSASICYVPGCVWAADEAVLVAGLIWCIEDNKMPRALEEIQRMISRRVLTRHILEVYHLFPMLGRQRLSDIGKLEDCLRQMFLHRWFEEGNQQFPHNYSRAPQWTVEKHIHPLLPASFAEISHQELWEGLKAVKDPQKVVPPAFLKAMLHTSGWPQASIVIEGRKGLYLSSLLHSDGENYAVDFWMGLVGLLDELRIRKGTDDFLGKEIRADLTNDKRSMIKVTLNGEETHLVEQIVKLALSPKAAGGLATRCFRRMVCSSGMGRCLRVSLLVQPDHCPKTEDIRCSLDDSVSLVVHSDGFALSFPRKRGDAVL